MNWRIAFLILGAPGIFIMLMLIPITDPGSQEEHTEVVPWFTAIKQLSRNSTFILAVIGSVFLTWAIGGM